MTYPMTVVDTVFKALAPAIPDRIPIARQDRLQRGIGDPALCES